MFFIGGDLAVNGKANVCSLFTITKEWKESELTWYNASDDKEWEMLDPDTKFYNPITDDSVSNPGGCDYDRKPVDIVDYIEINSWENYDVTEVIKQAVNNGKPFHGFMIKQYLDPAEVDKGINATAKGVNGRLYWSSEYDTLDMRPKLTVTYTSTGIGNQVSDELKEDIHLIQNGERITAFVPVESVYDISIFNIQGKRVISTVNCRKKKFDIPVNNLSSGVHIVTVESEQGTISKEFTFIR